MFLWCTEKDRINKQQVDNNNSSISHPTYLPPKSGGKVLV